MYPSSNVWLDHSASLPPKKALHPNLISGFTFGFLRNFDLVMFLSFCSDGRLSVQISLSNSRPCVEPTICLLYASSKRMRYVAIDNVTCCERRGQQASGWPLGFAASQENYLTASCTRVFRPFRHSHWLLLSPKLTPFPENIAVRIILLMISSVRSI